MSCCVPGAIIAGDLQPGSPLRPPDAGDERLDLIVPTVHCSACISRIETAIRALPDVGSARLNLSTRRLAITFSGQGDAERAIETVEALGYDCRRFDAAAAGASAEDAAGRELLRALAIAGFAAANVMLLSISVWAGADAATRDLFHWISALIALPAVVIAGRPFFRSAVRVLAMRQLNMDVPISLAVLLASGLSLHAVMSGGEEAFFDAAVMLLFFLLIGRYLDHRVRARARQAVTQLLSLWSSEATRISPDGGPARVPVESLVVGDRLLIAVGERIPADGIVEDGATDLDCAALTGESAPRLVHPGDEVQAGALALTHPITIRATAVGDDAFLAQAVRLMEEAESGRAKYLRLADRAARIYAPAVHLVALMTFIGWMITTGGDVSAALWVAVSVLIITCPCALGLAAPAVQVVASGALFRAGVLAKDGTALERLAEADRAVFDKTGTLTLGRARVAASTISEGALALAGALAGQSRHPLALALAEYAAANTAADTSALVEGAEEVPGAGIQGRVDGRTVKIGSAAFAGAAAHAEATETSEVWVSVDGDVAGRALFEDALRPGAEAAVATLTRRGYRPLLLSGDTPGAVAHTAEALGISDWRAAQSPIAKIEALEALKAEGAKPLMVGDGVNDGPALAAAHVSMAPASASDVGRAAADFVLLHENLDAVVISIDIARQARRLILQNFALAGAYNVVAIPIAITGHASPMIAAIAMSSSSIIVTLNALRLRLSKPKRLPANSTVSTATARAPVSRPKSTEAAA